MLDDPYEGVLHVVAFHGPKQENADLDKAIIAKVRGGGQPGLAAWAILGFLVHRGSAPEEILKAGLESDDPRARAAVAEALALHASDDNVARLVALLGDKDERVRGAAAAVLGNSGVKTPAVLGGLVKALDLAGESARQRIAAALSTLTGRAALRPQGRRGRTHQSGGRLAGVVGRRWQTVIRLAVAGVFLAICTGVLRGGAGFSAMSHGHVNTRPMRLLAPPQFPSHLLPAQDRLESTESGTDGRARRHSAASRAARVPMA